MLDAVIISDSGDDTLSASSPLRLQLDGRIALIQEVQNYLKNNGRIVAPVIGENEKNWHFAPKLNGIRLFSCLQRDGYHVALIDSYYKEREYFIKLLADNPKAIIISTTFILNKKSLAKLVKDIRGLAPDIFIIAGGQFIFSSYLLLKHCNKVTYDLMSPKDDFLFLSNDTRPDIDLYIIDRDGTPILSEALGLIKEKQSVKQLPNTAYWDNSAYAFSERKEFDPDDMWVDWRNIPEHIFKQGVINIQASMGCPFNCEFCNFVKDRKYTTVKPVDQLIKEIKDVSDRGIRYIRFVDDNFRLGKNDLNDVCRRFIKEGIDIKWMSFMRASTLESTDLELLKKAGCIEVQMGIESADATILKNMNKLASPVMYERVITRLLDTGINCSCCFIVGFPGETSDSFQRTVNFINNIQKNGQEGMFFWSIYPFLLVPLSPVYEAGKKAKYRLEGYMAKWKHATMNSEEAFQHIKKAFLTIENASPIYSGDNMDMLFELSSDQRKRFVKTRHDLSKRFLSAPFDKTLVINAFSKILD
jgi:radical SAM superfamily enzyme YgiQ (UPF0313 family)